jgi:hypothetical protein
MKKRSILDRASDMTGAQIVAFSALILLVECLVGSLLVTFTAPFCEPLAADRRAADLFRTVAQDEVPAEHRETTPFGIDPVPLGDFGDHSFRFERPRGSDLPQRQESIWTDPLGRYEQ